MKAQISQIVQRTRFWEFENGTTELIIGVVFFWAGISFQLAQSPLAVGIVIIPGVILLTKLVEQLPACYVYPRSGYIQYPETTRRGSWKGLLPSLILVAGSLALLLVYEPETGLAWAAPLLGLFVGFVCLFNARRTRLSRLALAGLIPAVLGMMLSPFGLGRELTSGMFGVGSLGFYFLVMGVIFLLTGGLTFRRYLRTNPLPMETSNE